MSMQQRHIGRKMRDSETASTAARVRLARRLNELLRIRGMTQRAASAQLGIPQPKISAIQNGRLHGISLERLMIALVRLDQRVEIKVLTAGTRPRRRISVLP